MKHIQKTTEPQFFKDDTQDLRKKIKTETNKSKIWDDDYKNKRALKEHILKNEQNYLCGYCESKLTLDDKELHLEHIKPKHLDYDNLTFDYSNLLVSCGGTCHTEGKKPLTCGHKKGGSFDEVKFLNPTNTQNIRDYFVYTDKGHIGASSLDETKSIYTMNLLQLNTFGNNLPEARLIALTEFRESVQTNATKTSRALKEIAIFLLSKENLAFISFLRFKYKKILQEQ
ncbi:retron system putative HNH endonuclease [Sulfurimonas sp.]|uniref:retron system putative HNH endonuclease n=1 Tax=Sulfurimonas sp. TaxID=2022749 RepID=UPI0026097E62|nr:retron system putative HNH endonuclease [Sulfurimonas sp.]MDD3856056.1 TIGR02646 family protein [Sulfurimonas sp.]